MSLHKEEFCFPTKPIAAATWCESIEYIWPANCQLLFYTLTIVNHTPETPTMWTLSQGAYKKTMKETWLAKKLSVFLAFLHSLRCFGQKMHRRVCGKGKRVFYHLVMYYYSLIIHSVICSYSVIHSHSAFLNHLLEDPMFFQKKCTSRISHQRFVKPATESPIGFLNPRILSKQLHHIHFFGPDVGALLVQVDGCKAQRETNPLVHSNQNRYVSHVFDYFDWLIISNLNNKCNSNMLQDFTKCNFYPPVVGPVSQCRL